MIKPDDMTFAQKMYLLGCFAIALSVKQKNKVALVNTTAFTFDAQIKCKEEWSHNPEEIEEFLDAIPAVARYLTLWNDEDYE